MHTLRRLPVPLPRHVNNHDSAHSGIVTSNSLTWKYGTSASPSENSTGSDTSLTHGYLLFYRPACKNVFSPDCPHAAPPILRHLNCRNDGRTSFDTFLSPTDLLSPTYLYITWLRPHGPGVTSFPPPLIAHMSMPPLMWLLVWPLSSRVYHAIAGMVKIIWMESQNSSRNGCTKSQKGRGIKKEDSGGSGAAHPREDRFGEE
jgi:hypothetical protein